MSGSSESEVRASRPPGICRRARRPSAILAGRGPVELGRTSGDYIPGIGMISTTSTHAPGII